MRLVVRKQFRLWNLQMMTVLASLIPLLVSAEFASSADVCWFFTALLAASNQKKKGITITEKTNLQFQEITDDKHQCLKFVKNTRVMNLYVQD